MTDGGDLDARLAFEAFDALRAQALETLELAVAEAPSDSPEQAAEHNREPGRLKESGRIVYIVNQETFDEDTIEQARTRIEELAREHRLYRVDAELRFETPYARYQHDRTDIDHPHGGKAKYLEHPIQIARPGLRERYEQVIA